MRTIRRPTKVKLVLGADTVLMGCAELARAVRPARPAGPIAVPSSWDRAGESTADDPTTAEPPLRGGRR